MNLWKYDFSLYFSKVDKYSPIIYNQEVKLFNNGVIRLRRFNNNRAKNLKKFKVRSSGTVKTLRIRFDSVKRKKDSIFDYAISNEWKYFITLTLDPKKIDRFDYNLCVKKLSLFLNNYRKIDSSFKYLIVPEEHEKGGYHFHGLIYCCDDYMIDSGHKTRGFVVYNWFKWKWGFSTATKVQDSTRVAYYITKYLTKSFLNKNNKRGFFHSRNLSKPQIYLNYSENKIDTDEFNLIWSTNVSSGYEKKIDISKFIE